MSLLELVAEIDEKINGVLTELEEVQAKLDRLLTKKVEKDWSLLEGASEQPTVTDIMVDAINVATNFAIPMTGKYQWYRLVDQEGKVRKCENLGCDAFLKYEKDKKSYEHWKYDPNTGKGGFVADRCGGVFQNL